MRHTMRRSYDRGDSGTGGWTLNTVVANGLVIGAIYGLVALGLTLVYKKSRVLNFAHGEVGMVGAFVFYVLFRTTHVALLFRASAADPYAASLMGIDVTRLDVATWTVAGALAGLAAILVAPLVGFDIFFMTLLAIRGFAAALLAGLTNVSGALAAGLALGLAEAALTRQTTQPGLPEAVLVVLVVGFLLRPQATVRRTA